MLDIALFSGRPKIQATMNEISSDRPLDSRGRAQTLATNALLGVLAAMLIAQMAPWGDGDSSGTVLTVLSGGVVGALLGSLLRSGVLVVIDGAVLVAYLVVAMTPIMTPIAEHWVRVDALPADTLDAVVALSAGLKSDSALSSTAADRLISALELVREGHARRLVTSRQVQPIASRLISSDSDQRRLIALASLEAAWVVVDSVHTTHDEAVRIAALLLPAGARRIVLVTSPMHTRRACAVFEAAGFDVYCRASRERDYATNPPEGKRDRLAALRAFGYEQMGMIKYRLRGWLTRRPVVTPGPGGSS